MRKKKTIKPEQLSNLRRPTEEEKQQIKGCLETYFNKANRIGNRVRMIFIVLAFIFLLNCINAGKGAIVYILFSMIMFAVWWVLGRSKKDGILCQRILEQGSYLIAEGKTVKLSVAETPGSILAYFENENGEKVGPYDVINKDVEVGTPLKLAVFDFGDDKRKYYYMFTSYMLSVGKYQP